MYAIEPFSIAIARLLNRSDMPNVIALAQGRMA